MNKAWSSYGNSYLRHLEYQRKSEDSMTWYTQSGSELQLALEAIQSYAIRMNYGKAKIEIHHGRIDMSIGSSKEMST